MYLQERILLSYKSKVFHICTSVFFEQKNKIKDLANIDRIICVKFPIKKKNPLLFEAISTYMIYDSCEP